MAAVVCHVDHLARLNLLQVEWKTMGEARFGIVEPEREFVKFESAIKRIRAATVAQCLHLRRLQRLEALRYFECLLQSFDVIDPGNRRGHRQAHRVS